MWLSRDERRESDFLSFLRVKKVRLRYQDSNLLKEAQMFGYDGKINFPSSHFIHNLEFFKPTLRRRRRRPEIGRQLVAVCVHVLSAATANRRLIKFRTISCSLQLQFIRRESISMILAVTNSVFELFYVI